MLVDPLQYRLEKPVKKAIFDLFDQCKLLFLDV